MSYHDNARGPEQQMNKLCVKTPFPNGTVAMETLASTNNFILTRSQIRSEKYRSIGKCAAHRLRARPPQSEGKGMLQTHYIERPALLSQHSRGENTQLGK